MEDRIEECLEKAAVKIMLDTAARERILKGVKAKKYSKKRLSLQFHRWI